MRFDYLWSYIFNKIFSLMPEASYLFVLFFFRHLLFICSTARLYADIYHIQYKKEVRILLSYNFTYKVTNYYIEQNQLYMPKIVLKSKTNFSNLGFLHRIFAAHPWFFSSAWVQTLSQGKQLCFFFLILVIKF